MGEHMKIKELRAITGLTQKKFSERFKIPLRTVQNWESGTNTPPEYIPRLIEMQMILENEIDQLRNGQMILRDKAEPDQEQEQPQEKEKDTDTVQKEILETKEELIEQWDEAQKEIQRQVNIQIDKNRKIWKMEELIKKLIKECDIEPKTSSFCKYKPEKGGCGKCTKPDYEDCNIKAWEGYEELERMIENV